MKFKLPIGDWSDDGHGKCDYFIIESNVPFKQIIETYHAVDEKYQISEICAEYEESTLNADEIKMIKEAGLKVEDYLGDGYDDTEYDGYIETGSMAKLVIDFIMLQDNSIKLEIINDEIPMLCNWTSPDKYLSLPGYGLFE